MIHGNEAGQRIAQIQIEFSTFEASTSQKISESRDKKRLVPAQEAEDRQQIRLAGDAAYAELERVVSRLVQLPRSRDEVSEQDSSLLDLVNKAIDEFKKLSATSQLNTFQLGTAMGDCESVRTGLRQHMDKMKAQCDTWNMESQSAWESSEGHRRSKDDYAGKQADFDDRARSTADEMMSIGGAFSSLFNDDLEQAANIARENASNNQRRREEAAWHENWTYRLSMIARNGGAGCLVLRDRAQAMYDEFGTEQLRIMEAQKVEAHLWVGLIDLSNLIADPEFQSSRDNSLRVILKILKADDNKFGAEDRYALVEQRIKSLITDKWGTDALAALLVPGAPRGVEGFLANF